MKVYTVKRAVDGKILSQWDSTFADETHYEENWGKRAYDEIIKAPIAKIGTIATDLIIHHPAEYVMSVEDVTAKIDAAKALIQARKIDHEERVSKLNAIDWSKDFLISDIVSIVNLLVKEVVMDDE